MAGGLSRTPAPPDAEPSDDLPPDEWHPPPKVVRDVVGVVTPLVRGVAQVLHGDQVVELSVQLEMQEREGKEEDREGQVEIESVRGELKERRTCTWMTSDETQT